MTTLRYAVSEALTSLIRERRAALLATGAIAVAFLMLGAFLLLSGNIQTLVQRWADTAELSVYLREDLGERAITALVGELSAHPAVAGAEYVSKEAARATFVEDFPDLSELAGGAENPFPPSIELRLKDDAASRASADELTRSLETRSEVSDVQYDRAWLARLLAIAEGIRLAGVAMGAILMLGAAFTVMAVVRLSLLTREAEIDIMQLVGAPFAVIRGPFVAQGALLGGGGALVAVLALVAVFALVRGAAARALAGLASTGEVRFLAVGEMALLLGGGLLLGAMAGVLATRTVRGAGAPD